MIFIRKIKIKMNHEERPESNDQKRQNILDYLDSNPVIYKKIQLGSYLQKLTRTETIPFDVDISNPLIFCVSVMEGIRSIIRRFYPDIKFCDSNGEIDKYDFDDEVTLCSEYENSEHVHKFCRLLFWIKKEDQGENTDFFTIVDKSFMKYFNILSSILSSFYDISIFVSEENDFSICIMIENY